MCCKSKEYGGLGLRDPSILNAALLKKLAWSLMTSTSFVYHFLRDRFFSTGFTQRQFWKSSTWCGLRSQIQPLVDESIWAVAEEIKNTVIGGVDTLTWRHSVSGEVTCADSYKSIAGPISKESFSMRIRLAGSIVDLWLYALDANFSTQVSQLWRSALVTAIWAKPSRALRIVEVHWQFPPAGWLKVNTDGSGFGSPSLAGYGSIFRTSRGFCKGAFAIPLGKVFAFEVELAGAIHAISCAYDFGWTNLWLECDSTYLVTLLRKRSPSIP
ncbi:Ribonuclease H-like domain containing protein [Parasponia andersonii]|uniref:Ribonuclease H-like domain containing protein n=1 Tax=Parasponia andersonii TaxID=3476 RepID=A0A2P5C5Z9_PARAD|nr:Ribonuclease H-like domain containing protein [Parasponia andersonii]